MKVEHIVFIVEEPSMEAALLQIVPKILGEASFQIIVHQGKKDLLERLPDRLRGYKRFVRESWRIVILIDRDDEDCLKLKRRLEDISRTSGLRTKSTAAGSHFTVVNRIAVEELEAWYFGDWQAVRRAYPNMPATIPSQARYRNPDAVAGGAWEAFERIAKRAGYFDGGLRKTEAARSIAMHMDCSENASPSFQVFHRALAGMRSE